MPTITSVDEDMEHPNFLSLMVDMVQPLWRTVWLFLLTKLNILTLNI